MTLSTLVRATATAAFVLLVGSCKESSAPPAPIGPPSQLVLVSSQAISAPANTDVAAVQISVQDAGGHRIANQTVTFAVTAGGGSLSATSGTSDANGTVTLPTWKLGKSAIEQTVRATLGSITKDITATVATQYNIDVRFFGSTMTPAQQALFTQAAARIRGFITGDVANVSANVPADTLAKYCGVTGQPSLNETIDDVIIYASIQPIDSTGKILAQAGPCYFRLSGTPARHMTAIGTMKFDSADIQTITGAGSFQEVIMHEMLHVLGFGVQWEDTNSVYLQGKGTSDPRFTGPLARQNCVAVGGSVTCATSVPLEATGGAGTAESHWREAAFDTELMTGFVDASPNPLSSVTIGSMADIGYTVNGLAFDQYAIPGGQLRASNLLVASQTTEWEQRLQHKPRMLPRVAQAQSARKQ